MKIPVLYSIERFVRRFFKPRRPKEGPKQKLLTTDYNEWKKRNTANLNQVSWEKNENFVLESSFPERYALIADFLTKKIIPLLSKDDCVCDLACACGEFSFLVAPYVKYIDAYDLSPGMIDRGKKEAALRKIENINFDVANALSIELNGGYHKFMLLGLLTCIESDTDCQNILDKAAKSLEPGGYLVVRDTLIDSDKDHFFVTEDYASIYRTKDNYTRFLINSGFEIIDEDKVIVNKQGFISYCCLAQKIKNGRLHDPIRD